MRARSELAFDILHRGGGVFDSIVKPGGGDHLFVVDRFSDQVSHRLEVHVVRLIRVLSALIDARMRLRGIFDGAVNQVFHRVRYRFSELSSHRATNRYVFG